MPVEVQAPMQPFSSDQTIGSALALMTRAFAAAGIRFCSTRRAVFAAEPSRARRGSAADATSAMRSVTMRGASVTLCDAGWRTSRFHALSGQREFYGRNFVITPDVLDPRPDTETVIDLALDIIKSKGLAEKALSIADIGTGSGILIATLLAELPNARGIATDVSPAALAVARQNAERLGVAERVDFRRDTRSRRMRGALGFDRFEPTLYCNGQDCGA